jgi:hypothetical protein
MDATGRLIQTAGGRVGGCGGPSRKRLGIDGVASRQDLMPMDTDIFGLPIVDHHGLEEPDATMPALDNEV